MTQAVVAEDEHTPLLSGHDRLQDSTRPQYQHDPCQDAMLYATIADADKAPSAEVEEVASQGASTPDAHDPENNNNDNSRDHDDADSPNAAVMWTVFPVLLAGIFLSNVVSSVVLATNQHIASEFGALTSAAWLLTTYTLAQSASQPLYGKLSDIFGRRSCLVFCWLVFGIGCLLSGLGTRYWHIILGRAVSGVGSAGKIALTSVVVADLVPLRRVAAYRAYVNLTATTARSLGGPIGGWLAGSVGWRWPFVVQFPLALLGLLLVVWKLPEPSTIPATTTNTTTTSSNPSPQEQEHEHEQERLPSEKSSGFARIDFAGAISLVATIVSGMLALDLASKGTAPPILSILTACAFIVFATLFVWIERRPATTEPILPLSLVTRRDVLAAYLLIGLQSAAQFGLLYSIPIYFQVVERESVGSAGTRIVPVVVGNALGTVCAGRYISRARRYKALTAAAGNGAGLLGFTLLLLRWRGGGQGAQGRGAEGMSAAESLYVVLPGVGMGVVQSASFVHLAASVPRHDEIAMAGTAWFLAQNIGVLIGASLSTALINGVLKASLLAALAGEDNAAQIIKRVTSNVGSIASLPDHLRALVTKAYVDSLRCSDALSIVFLCLALLVTINVREKPL